MRVPHRDDTDIVKEFRLRRWAREHHVPVEERRPTWHPVVLDEMRRKDDDILIRARSRPPASSFVPLVPTVIQRVHPRDEQIPAVDAPAANLADRPQGLQRADLAHESVIAHVGTVMPSETHVGSVQVTTINGE